MRFRIGDFFDDITHFFKYKRTLGVDIGTVAIKAVEIEQTTKDVFLRNYGILEKKDYLDRANDAIQTTSLKLDPERTAVLLKTLVKEMKPSTDRVVASIPLFSVFVVPIEMPMMSPEETKRSILFQARQYIPIPLEDATLDWIRIEAFENEKGRQVQKILLSAIPNELLDSYKMIFQHAGLKLSAIEIESFSLARSLLRVEPNPVMIIDIGAESTGFAIAENGVLKQTAQVDYGGVSLTQALARSLDISVWRAEELKKRRGLLGFGAESDLSTSLEPFLDVILQEGDRARDVYERTFGKKIQKWMVVGGGANLPGIMEYLNTRIQTVFLTPYPFAHIKYSPDLEPAIKSLSNELALAAGLALKFYGAASRTI